MNRDELTRRAEQVKLLLLDVDGVLTDGRIRLGEHDEVKAYHAQDGLGVTLARSAGILVGLITGRRSATVERRGRELKLDFLVQGRPDKLQAFEELRKRAGVKSGEVCFMGDDWIDLSLLSRVGLPACPADARPEVRERCVFVSSKPGGGGAIRELVETLLRLRGQFDELLESYLRGRGAAASGQ